MNDRKRQYIKLLTNTLYDVQAVRKAIDNRIGAFVRSNDVSAENMADELKESLSDLSHQMEMNIEKQIGRAVQSMPITKWLKLVRGIGPRLSGSLIGMLEDIGRFDTVAKLWAYCGMDVIPVCQVCSKICLQDKNKHRFLSRQTDRRWQTHLLQNNGEEEDSKARQKLLATEELFKETVYKESLKKLCQCDEPEPKDVAPKRQYFKGLLLTHNPFLRMTCWKVAGQFVRQGKFYRTYYETQKEFYTNRDGDKISKLHVENRARRATSKLFLSHLWEMWRKSEGLEAGQIYLQYKLGDDFDKYHTYINPPYFDIYG